MMEARVLPLLTIALLALSFATAQTKTGESSSEAQLSSTYAPPAPSKNAVLRSAFAGIRATIATHTMNASFTGATSGWPTTADEFAKTTQAVTNAVCSVLTPRTQLPVCEAFLMSVADDVIALQVYVQTTTPGDGEIVFAALQSWALNFGSTPFSAVRVAVGTALGTNPSLAAFSSGTYIMPCRSSGVYSFLPVCVAKETPSINFYIDQPTGNTVNFVTDFLCRSIVGCDHVTVVQQNPSPTVDYTTVTITNATFGLEAVLAYVAEVRAAFAVASGLPPPGGEFPTGSVTANAVWLTSHGMEATLFSTTENTRYGEQYKTVVECAASTGYWAFALIAIAPLAVILFRYVWYKGRHNAKKYQRRLIVEDEKRMMEGYMNPGNNEDAIGYPPPGMDADEIYYNTYDDTAMNESPQQWAMDEHGNYYAVPAATNDADATGYDLPQSQYASGAAYGDTEMDPATQQQQQQMSNAAAEGDEAGDYYYYSLGEGEEAPDERGGAANPEEEAAGGYYTYVDPTSGETYEYLAPQEESGGVVQDDDAPVDVDEGVSPEYDEAEGGDVDAAQLGDDYNYDGAEGNTNPNEIQYYVDPATGETYQYTTEQVEEAQ